MLDSLTHYPLRQCVEQAPKQHSRQNGMGMGMGMGKKTDTEYLIYPVG